ncbi:MAG TPA: hypothetical protein VGJ14_09720 [Sporichthyaceae bacterium]|jgi:hypothetical protein
MLDPPESESFEVDLFTVLTALGSGLHRDLTPISEGGQYALANALVLAAGEEGWSFAEVPTRKLYDAVLAARRTLTSPLALVPADVADPEVLVELGVDPQGPTDIPGLLKAKAAVQVVPGLVLLARTGGSRRRDGTRSVTIPLPGRTT